MSKQDAPNFKICQYCKEETDYDLMHGDYCAICIELFPMAIAASKDVWVE